MKYPLLRWAAVLPALMLTLAAQAQQACPAGLTLTTPDADFADAGPGMVLHKPSGLVWKRCAEGQTWSGGTCTGTAASYTWQQAFERADAVNAAAAGTQNLGATDWRLPNINELQSIAELACRRPAINLTQFPATPASEFWSGSPFAGNPGGAWGVYFNGASDGWLSRSFAFRVRLVRAGQSFLNFDAALGTVIVRKQVNGAAAASVPADAEFPITLSCGATSFGPSNATTAAPAVFSGVPPGDCTVAEGAPPTIAGVSWGTPSYSPAASITVAAGASVEVTVSNPANVSTYTVDTIVDPTGSGTLACNSGNPVAHGNTATCTATPSAGYSVASISGCGGTATGAGVTSFTTGPVTGDCTVTASFALQVEGACGSADGVPAMAAPAADLCSAGTASAVTGTGPWNWSCAGSAGGGTASCSAPVFVPVTHFSGPSPTGSGTVTVDLSGGGPFCGFIGTPAMIAAAPGANPATPAGVSFPHGLFEFTASNCTPGSTITLTMKVPSDLPATARYWKWGPEPGNATPHWYEMPATIAGDTITFSITDGGQGDDDLDATNGTIVDQGGPGLPPAGGVTPVPTLGEWGLMLLGLLAAGLGAGRLRSRHRVA